jgi:uncharacterized protein GlcG (DUF336 family)
MKIRNLLALPALCAAIICAVASLPAQAQDATVAECRKRGYQVAVAVVDRFGTPQAMLRDRFAGAHTVPTATGKAWTAASFKMNTTELTAASQSPAMQGLRNLPNVVMIGGGAMIEAGGSLLGAIGVSGAPGGDADEECAKSGIAAISDKLDF